MKRALIVLACVLPFSPLSSSLPSPGHAQSATEDKASAAQTPGESVYEPKALMGSPEIPSYYIVSAFLRRASLVLERPVGQRPDFFATFGCTLGNERYQACQDLINQGAQVHGRDLDAETDEENQAGLDAKAKDIAQIYAKLLKLLTATPEAARNWHTKVEEVRPTVGIVLTDEPGQDLFQAARAFDQELEKLYPGALQLPGFVKAKSAAAPSGTKR